MKSCIRCNKTKYVFEFYKHKQMGDGHLNKCKDCCKKESSARERLLRGETDWVESERLRGREKYHRLYSTLSEKELDENFNRIWMTAEEVKASETENRRRWKMENPEKEKMRSKLYRDKYPEKYKAHSNSQRLPCTKGNQLHHWSYNEEHWKDCIELNVADHALLHRYIKYDQERYMYRNLDGILLDTKQSHIDLLESLKSKGVA